MVQKLFFKQLELVIFESVYFPQEDSVLLAENVTFSRGNRVLDLGCGCGIQGLNAAILGASQIVCSDINPVALKNAKKNAVQNGFQKKFSFIESSFFSGFKKNEKFDCIIFNPPYVPSGKEKKWTETDGGKKGRETLDFFLEQCGAFLKKNGTVFFLQSSLNGVSLTEKKLEKLGLGFEIIAKQKLFFEELVVFKAWKK